MKETSYDMKKISGGFNGRVYVDFGMFGEKKLTVSLGLYSGGDNEGFKIPFDRKEKFSGNSAEKWEKELTMTRELQKEIGKIVVNHLKTFESNVVNDVNNVLEAYK